MNNIQWNKVTWYSKTFALILFVALPFVGFYCGMRYGELKEMGNNSTLIAALQGNTGTKSESGTLDQYYTDPSTWQTDANNTAGGFSIAYPIDFDAQDNSNVKASTDWRVNATSSGMKYFTLVVPKAFEPQTNFGNATLTVGASSNKAAVAQCILRSNDSDQKTATSSATINGVPFTIFYSSDIGAGNIYETVSYRTVRADKCYAVEYTVHSAQIENYPSSYNLKSYDEAKIAKLMQNIIGTFKFL